MSLAERYEIVRRSIAAACARVDRDPGAVRLVAVTKYAPIDAVRELVDLGHRDLGESRPQQLIERAKLFESRELSWHLIGTLQRNKARKVLPVTTTIHSADDLRLLQTLERLADELRLRPQVLIEVNVAGEAAKQGFSPDVLYSVWPRILELRNLDLRGLMTMAPYSDDPETARPVFRSLRILRDELSQRGSLTLAELSMGMSGDYEVAIEEGATIVRLGSSLFGE
ncbi:MAG: YggS family pyridoxal phosphate-dependent enzyme [Planctomycetaceae bacterium]|nr:YggS family pyridoxal phosphate-dependent enzyme [Planctomycetaceae bacterium]